VVASAAQDTGDYLVESRMSKNLIQVLPAHDVAWWARSELRNVHRCLAKKEMRKYRQYHMSKFSRRVLELSSKSLTFQVGELQAYLVPLCDVEVSLGQVEMEAWRPRKKHKSRDEDGVASQSVLAVILDQRLVSLEGEAVLLVESH
jgi:hypothetical protein